MPDNSCVEEGTSGGPPPSPRSPPSAAVPPMPVRRVTVATTDEPPAVPEGKEIHPRRNIPRVPEGIDRPDPTVSPPVDVEEPWLPPTGAASGAGVGARRRTGDWSSREGG